MINVVLMKRKKKNKMNLMKNILTRQMSIQDKKRTLRMVLHLEAKTKIALD